MYGDFFVTIELDGNRIDKTGDRPYVEGDRPRVGVGANASIFLRRE